MTQVELAVAVETERSHLAKVELGKYGMAAEKLIEIARVTGAPIGWLMGEGDPELGPELTRQFEWNRIFGRLDPETFNAVMLLIRQQEK